MLYGDGSSVGGDGVSVVGIIVVLVLGRGGGGVFVVVDVVVLKI